MSGPMRGGDPTRGGAIWCEAHGRYECTRNRQQSRGGGRCHGLAIAGLDACRMHSGKRAEVARAQGEAITAWSALSGEPVVSPGDAVLGMLQMSWLRVHLYAGLLERQVADADPDDSPGGAGLGSSGVGRGAGLIGHTFGAVKDLGTYASGEAIRGLALLEAQERDRCVRYAKTAHDMGIAEQQIRVAEQQGVLLAGAVSRILDALGLSPAQRALVPQVVPQVLRAVAEQGSAVAAAPGRTGGTDG